VTTLSLGGEEVARASTGVDHGRLDDDVAVLEELADAGTGIGGGNLGGLLRVQPDWLGGSETGSGSAKFVEDVVFHIASRFVSTSSTTVPTPSADVNR
jgi:hypothetical protein